MFQVNWDFVEEERLAMAFDLHWQHKKEPGAWGSSDHYDKPGSFVDASSALLALM